jgi:hypothetical protein
MAQRINRHPAMTNALRAQLRLTVPKPRQRRGVGPEIPGVRLEVDAGRVVVHFGTNPDDERRNGKPDWAIGANKCLCVGFSTCPPPNLPRGRGRSRDSLPARGEGWGGGDV